MHFALQFGKRQSYLELDFFTHDFDEHVSAFAIKAFFTKDSSDSVQIVGNDSEYFTFKCVAKSSRPTKRSCLLSLRCVRM